MYHIGGHRDSNALHTKGSLDVSPWRLSATADSIFEKSQIRRSQKVGIDPNKLRLTGENSFLRLGHEEGGESTAQNSHWRIHVSPKGVGHALFTKSEFTNGEPRIYADNIALARWLQEGIMESMSSDYSGENILVIEADFWKVGDAMTYWTEYIESADEKIALTWYDFDEAFAIANAPEENPGQPHGLYNVIVPAARAQMTVNGEAAAGKAFPRDIFGRPGSTCCLALSETWLIPPDHEWAKE